MKNLITLSVLSLTLLLTVGCGHTITSYSKGGGIQISWTPDTFVPSVRAGWYEFVLAMFKENAHMKYSTNVGMGIGNDIFGIASIYAMATADKNKSGNVSTGSGTVLQVRTGPMINGYTQKVLTSPNFGTNQVEALKALTVVDTKLDLDTTKVAPFSTETNVQKKVETSTTTK